MSRSSLRWLWLSPQVARNRRVDGPALARVRAASPVPNPRHAALSSGATASPMSSGHLFDETGSLACVYAFVLAVARRQHHGAQQLWRDEPDRDRQPSGRALGQGAHRRIGPQPSAVLSGLEGRDSEPHRCGARRTRPAAVVGARKADPIAPAVLRPWLHAPRPDRGCCEAGSGDQSEGVGELRGAGYQHLVHRTGNGYLED